MTVTLKDVAKRAGVSIKTVSNVVRGYEHVTEDMRQRVQAALDELQYQPNLSARFLRTKHTGVLALAIPLLNNPYFTEIAQSIIEAANQHSYTVFLDYTAGLRANELLVVNSLRPHSIDGILMHPFSLQAEDLKNRQERIPIVLLGERLLDFHYDHVSFDNIQASYLATQHLIHLGRRRIAAIGIQTLPTGETARLRIQGYCQALQEAHLPLEPQLLVEATAAYSRTDGREAVRYLLTLDPKPDALFCFNDLMALGAMQAIQEAGYRIPEDIAVVGFDDIEEGRFATPSLTTISPNKQQLAETALSLLLQRIQTPENKEPKKIDIPFSLVARESTLGRIHSV